MDPEDIIVEVRSRALGRLGQIGIEYLTDAKFIKRFNNVGFWSFTLDADHEQAYNLMQPGHGIVVTGPNDRILISGGMTSADYVEDVDDPEGRILFQGADDNIHLSDASAFPEPTNPDVSTQAVSHDVRTGNCETVMRAYVAANIIPGIAPAERAVPDLALSASDLGRGGYVIGRARFDTLGKLEHDLAAIGGLGFDMVQVGDVIEFQIYEPQDRTGDIRMDIDNGMLEEARYGYGAPTATRVILAGQGEGVDRKIIQVTSADAVNSEVLWRRKIELFKDRRDTNDDAELQQDGDETVASGGVMTTSMSVTPSDEINMVLGRDWWLGDRVTVTNDEQDLQAVVKEVIISITTEGVRTAATIGDTTGFDFESKMITTVQNHEERIGRLETENTAGGGSGPTDYYTKTETDDLLSNKSDVGHNHDDRYYTESEINALLASVRVPAGNVDWTMRRTAPTGWLFLDGSVLNKADYPDLWEAIQLDVVSTSTTFTLPRVAGRSIVGLDPTQGEFNTLGETGGAKTVTLTIAEMPSHSHVQNSHSHSIADPGHNHTQDPHNHSQNAHNHSQNSHSHGVSDPGHNHSQNQHRHTNFDVNGTAIGWQKDIMTDGTADGVYIGVYNDITTGWTTATNNSSGTGVSVNSATASNNAATATNNATTATNNSNTTGISVNGATATNQDSGGGQAHDNLSPYIVMNAIIKT